MMPNDKTVEPQHSSCVDVKQDSEVQYWSEKFGVSRDALISAVAKVGPQLADLEMHFSGPGAGESLPRGKRQP